MKSEKKKIAILGCGWVGNVLKDRLAFLSYEVQCLSRDINENISTGAYDCDGLLIAISPTASYLADIEKTLHLVSLQEVMHTQVILLSSTSFYDGKEIIMQAESLVKKKTPDAVILRLSGLMGYDRIAGKYTQGKTIKDGVTNYVHRDDVVGVLERIIHLDVRNDVFDVVAPIQSSKKQIFTQNEKQFGLDKTVFDGVVSKKKSLTSKRLCNVLGYTFQKIDVREFWQQI